MNTQILIALFFTHWIGDFVLQSDWMARNKSKNWYALARHVAIYTMTLFALACIVDIINGTRYAMAFALLNGVLHFVTDAITSRITAKLYAKNEIHYFFVVVGFDQFIHLTTLVLTLPFLF